MKKLFCLMLALTLLFCGCGAKPAEPQAAAPEGTPAELIEKIYAAHKEVDLALVTMELDLTDSGAVSYNTGLDSAEKLASAAVSETMLGQPYSMVIARVKNAADAPQVAKDLYEKIDMRKWICVMADTKTAAYCGDVVMFFMVSSDFADTISAESVAAAFNSVCGGKATIIA